MPPNAEGFFVGPLLEVLLNTGRYLSPSFPGHGLTAGSSSSRCEDLGKPDGPVGLGWDKYRNQTESCSSFRGRTRRVKPMGYTEEKMKSSQNIFSFRMIKFDVSVDYNRF